MKKILISVLIGLVAIGTLMAAGGSEGGRRQHRVYSLATAGLGGTYYIVGAGLGEILTREIPHLTVNAIIAGGSTGNPLMLHRNEAEIGITNYISAANAIAGNAPFEQRIAIAGIAPLQYSQLHIMVMGNSPFHTLNDLRGRRVNLGPAAGGGALFFRELLPFWGLSESDFNFSFLSYTEGTEALRDGRIDANTPNGAAPLETVSSLAAFTDVRLISLEAENMRRVRERLPHYDHALIPGGTYRGINQDVWTGGIQDILVVRADMEEEEAYLITRTIYEHLVELRRVHPSVSHMTFDNYNHSLVPLHPGALRFYRERGIPIQ
jgi:hypothetical protein